VCPHSSKASRREDLEIEEPGSGGYSAAFHFHPTLTRMLGATLIRHQVVQVRQPDKKRLLAPFGMMEAFHCEQLPLDVSIQAQILNLLRQLQGELHLTYLFIAHDLSVIRHIIDRVAVMYVRKIVETGTVQQIFETPRHPYTQALLAAVPLPNLLAPPPRLTLAGEVVSPINPPRGCRLYGRCPLAGPECAEIDPQLRDRGGEHFVACHKV
jgi:oligopeptide/dipeptide ABC transporter ATP-binding protein